MHMIVSDIFKLQLHHQLNIHAFIAHILLGCLADTGAIWWLPGVGNVEPKLRGAPHITPARVRSGVSFAISKFPGA